MRRYESSSSSNIRGPNRKKIDRRAPETAQSGKVRIREAPGPKQFDDPIIDKFKSMIYLWLADHTLKHLLIPTD